MLTTTFHCSTCKDALLLQRNYMFYSTTELPAGCQTNVFLKKVTNAYEV